MGLRGIPETEIRFEDLEVPADQILLPPEGVRRGFAGLMTAYNAQRVGAATVALGIAQGAYDLALDYAQSRHQFRTANLRVSGASMDAGRHEHQAGSGQGPGSSRRRQRR